MITPADPLPDDLETAHQLIRESLETLGQQLPLNAELRHQLEAELHGINYEVVVSQAVRLHKVEG